MLKRIIGVLFALFVLATILCAALEYGSYESMLFSDGEEFVLEGLIEDELVVDPNIAPDPAPQIAPNTAPQQSAEGADQL